MPYAVNAVKQDPVLGTIAIKTGSTDPTASWRICKSNDARTHCVADEDVADWIDGVFA